MSGEQKWTPLALIEEGAKRGETPLETIRNMSPHDCAEFLLYVSGNYKIEQGNRCAVCRYKNARYNCMSYTCLEGVLGFLVNEDPALYVPPELKGEEK